MMRTSALLVAPLLLFGCKEEPTAVEEAKKAQEAAMEAAKHAMKAAEAAKEEAAEAAKGAAETAEKQVDPQNLGEAMQKMQEAMGKMQSNVDPVSYKTLKGLLPEKAGEFTRKKTRGQKAGAMGFKVSHAEGDYEGPDGAKLSIKITDTGSMKGFAGMASAQWAMVELERESDEGFERTFTYKGNKAYEKYQNGPKRAQLNTIVASRFVVELQGRKVEMKAVKAALEDVDLDALAEMKDEGVKKAAN